MNKYLKGAGLAAVLIILALSPLLAQTGYVSDMLLLTFREGPGTNYTVLKTLKSNTPLTVLEEDQEYYKVELASGEQGWVDKQFVVFEPPKTIQMAQLEKENADLTQRLTQAQNTLDRLKSDLAAGKSTADEKLARLENRVRETQKQNKHLTQQLTKGREALRTIKAASADVMKTLEANKALTAENERLSMALEKIEDKSNRLLRTGMIKWFLAGVGVLLLGWLIGLMLSGKRRRGNSLLD